jgi:protein phosphatase
MTDQPVSDESAGAAAHFSVRVALRTDVGLVRSENQDFGTFTTADEERGAHAGGRLLLVADGMGGHRGGARASRLAAETVKSAYLESATRDVATALMESFTRANAAIYSEAQANPDLRGMGTTTSALVIKDGHGFFGHVGDSRIYRVRRDEVVQLTDDHSLVASMVREGLLTAKEAEVHPRRNVLQRSMGVGEQVEIDVRGPFAVELGDTYILCSDGLHGVVKEDELRELATLTIEEAADECVRRVLARGAPDNVTVIVARIEPGSAPVSSPHDGLLLDETQRGDAFDDTERMAARDPESTDIIARGPRAPRQEREPQPQTAAEAVSVPQGDVQIATPALDAEPVLDPEPATAGAIDSRAAAPQPPVAGSGARLKWIVITVLVIAALAAWFAFSHHADVALPAAVSPSAR